MPEHKTTILFVDDEPRMLQVLQKIFSKIIDGRVDYVQDNPAAIDAISRNRPDLVISDIVRPIASGIDLFRQLRGDPKTASIPFIFVSGQIARHPELEPKLYREGADGVFPKPYPTEELIICVQHVLRVSPHADLDLLLLGLETRDLDYKEDIDLGTKLGRANLAKDVLAMANAGGGSIIIGVSEDHPGNFEFKGLSNKRIEKFETTRLNDALAPYIGSSVAVRSRAIKYRASSFIIIKVPSSGDTLAMAIRSNQNASLFTGRIYTRTDAARTEEVQDSLEVLRLIDRIASERLRRILYGPTHLAKEAGGGIFKI